MKKKWMNYLPGFKSPWIILQEWQYDIPDAIWIEYSIILSIKIDWYLEFWIHLSNETKIISKKKN